MSWAKYDHLTIAPNEFAVQFWVTLVPPAEVKFCYFGSRDYIENLRRQNI
jgi:hypothetical protein